MKKEVENQTKNWSKASQNRTSDKTVVVNRSSVKPVNRSLITECSVSRIIWAGPFSTLGGHSFDNQRLTRLIGALHYDTHVYTHSHIV